MFWKNLKFWIICWLLHYNKRLTLADVVFWRCRCIALALDWFSSTKELHRHCPLAWTTVLHVRECHNGKKKMQYCFTYLLHRIVHASTHSHKYNWLQPFLVHLFFSRIYLDVTTIMNFVPPNTYTVFFPKFNVDIPK